MPPGNELNAVFPEEKAIGANLKPPKQNPALSRQNKKSSGGSYSTRISS